MFKNLKEKFTALSPAAKVGVVVGALTGVAVVFVGGYYAVSSMFGGESKDPEVKADTSLVTGTETVKGNPQDVIITSDTEDADTENGSSHSNPLEPRTRGN